MNFPKPVVVVSRCLEFEPVRYNGQIMPCPLVKELEPFVDYIKVCPEYEIGLGVPRDPIRIVKQKDKLHLIQPKTKEDITDKMNKFTQDFIDSLPEIDGFIFKSDSPTIGLRNIKIYSGIEKAPVVQRGHGFFAGQLLDAYPEYPMEEENRLRNNSIRHSFLVKLFVFAAFRSIKNDQNQDQLNQFHNQHHYLYSLYDPAFPKQATSIIEKKDGSFESKANLYFEKLKDLFHSHPSTDDYIRVWNDLLSYFDNKISSAEKEFINSLMQKYRDNRICQSGVNDYFFSLALRFPDGFIEHQRIFEPYPSSLLPVVDEKRDKDYWNKS